MAHAPDAQLSVARASSHAAPHAPQSDAVVIGVSQPFDGSASQSSKPASHDTISQPLAPHASMVFGRAQVAPHAPQSASDPRKASQPSDGSPLQSA
jgi:hypothetical protein